MMIETNEQRPLFDEFDKEFQEKILQALIFDRQWAQQMAEVVCPEHFGPAHLRFIAERFSRYYLKYKDFPSLQMLGSIVRDDLAESGDVNMASSVADYVRRMRSNPDSGDLHLVKDKALDFCRRQAFKLALEDAISDVMESKYESIVDKMKKAISTGMPVSVGHDLFTDFDARFSAISRKCVPTGFPELDEKTILNGGLGRGELFSILASSGVGKSHFLVALGANALRRKRNVLHYTFELSEAATGIRYDSNLCAISATDVTTRKNEIMAIYEKSSKDFGKLIIKEFPSGFATINTLKAHVEKLAMSRGFQPDIIIIDYADIMRSTRQYDSLRHELKLVYEDLRSWATELGIPIATASQTNREATTHDVVELKNVSEAYGKIMVADVVLTLSRKLNDESTGRLHVAKNRAGRDRIVFLVDVDTSMSSFTIKGKYTSPDEAKNEHVNEVDQIIKDGWRDLHSQRMFGLKAI